MPSRHTEPAVPYEDDIPPQPSIMDDIRTDPQDTFEYAIVQPDMPNTTYDGKRVLQYLPIVGFKKNLNWLIEEITNF